MKELKPCPYCGGEVKTEHSIFNGICMIFCPKCGAITSFKGKETAPKAIKAWNRRIENGNYNT